jgi:RNA polymerase sigma-70 factor (ECF subfamily)
MAGDSIERDRGREDVASTGLDELATWLEEGYTRSFRTACLILGNRADAEEAVQEAFLRAWRFRDSLSSGSDVRRWLYRVVVNTCNSKLREEIPHRDRRSSDEELGSVSTAVDSQGQAALAHDMGRALLDLPVHLRIVVVLRYYSDLSEREIATAIGRPTGTVKSRLHEARRLLAAHPSLRADATALTSNSEANQ